jgi:hypothetical protein
MTGMQKEILDAYEQANRAWLARVKSEVEFWSELTSKLAATRSVQEALEIYQKSTAQRHADGDRGRAAIDRGLSKDHAEVRRFDVQRMAHEEHVSSRSSLCRFGAGELHPRNERNSDGRAHVSMGDPPWNRPATTM